MGSTNVKYFPCLEEVRAQDHAYSLALRMLKNRTDPQVVLTQLRDQYEAAFKKYRKQAIKCE